MLNEIVKKLKNIKNSNIIIKLHPGENPHNTIVLEQLNQISGITIYQTKNSKDLLLDCKLLVNISPELYDSSTIMLEGLILQKPVIQLILDEEFSNIQPLNSPIIQVNDLNNLFEMTKKIFENSEYRKNLIEKFPP